MTVGRIFIIKFGIEMISFINHQSHPVNGRLTVVLEAGRNRNASAAYCIHSWLSLVTATCARALHGPEI